MYVCVCVRRQRWSLTEDEYWVDHLVAHILGTGSDTGIMWKPFCEQAVAQGKLKQRNYPNAISTRRRGFYTAYKIIAHCKNQTGACKLTTHDWLLICSSFDTAHNHHLSQGQPKLTCLGGS